MSQPSIPSSHDKKEHDVGHYVSIGEVPPEPVRLVS